MKKLFYLLLMLLGIVTVFTCATGTFHIVASIILLKIEDIIIHILNLFGLSGLIDSIDFITKVGI